MEGPDGLQEVLWIDAGVHARPNVLREVREEVVGLKEGLNDGRGAPDFTGAQPIEQVLHLVREIGDLHEAHGSAASLQGVGGSKERLDPSEIGVALEPKGLPLQDLQLLGRLLKEEIVVLLRVVSRIHHAVSTQPLTPPKACELRRSTHVVRSSLRGPPARERLARRFPKGIVGNWSLGL